MNIVKGIVALIGSWLIVSGVLVVLTLLGVPFWYFPSPVRGLIILVATVALAIWWYRRWRTTT